MPSKTGCCPRGVRVSGFAVARYRYDRQVIRRASSWARDYLCRPAPARLGCPLLGKFAAAQIRFDHDVIGTHMAFSLALSMFRLATIRLAGGIRRPVHRNRFRRVQRDPGRRGGPRCGDRGLLICDQPRVIPRPFTTTACLNRQLRSADRPETEPWRCGRLERLHRWEGQ